MLYWFSLLQLVTKITSLYDFTYIVIHSSFDTGLLRNEYWEA